MAFNWGGAAAGASEALRQIQKDRQDQVTEGLRAKVLMEQLASSDEERKARAEQRRTQNAAITLQQLEAMGGGANEVDPTTAAQLRNSPYRVRLEDKATLPSSTIPGVPNGAAQSDLGGRPYATLRPTLAQEQTQGQKTAKLRFVDLVRRHAPRNDIIAAMVDAGGNVPESAFDDPNLPHAQRMEEIAAQGEQARRTALTSAGAARAAAPIGPRDRVSARRQADAAASDYLDSLARSSGGFLPANVDPDAIRAQFIDAYMAELEPASAPNASRAMSLDELQRGMRPVGSRQTPRLIDLRPRNTPRPGAGSSWTGASGVSSDPFEQYLARTRGIQ
jgi:hypothetical protein